MLSDEEMLALMCREDDIINLKYMAKCGFPLNIPQPITGYYPLHLAAEHGSYQCAEYLVSDWEIIASVNQRADDGVSRNAANTADGAAMPLHLAVVAPKNALKMTRLLIGYYANKRAYYDGKLAIHWACEGGASAAIIELLLRGLTAFPEDLRMGELPHHFAIRGKNVDALRVLFEYEDATGLTTRNRGLALIVAAAYLGDVGVLRMVFERYGPDISKLHVERHNVLRMAIDSSTRCDYIVAQAVHADSAECVDFLLERDVKLHPLTMDRFRNCGRITEPILKAVVAAVRKGGALLDVILRHIPADVIAAFNDISRRVLCLPRYHPLMLACDVKPDSLETLLKGGFSPDTLNRNTEINWSDFGASPNSQGDLRAFATTNAAHCWFHNLLIYAALKIKDAKQRSEAIDLFIKYGANVNVSSAGREQHDELPPLVFAVLWSPEDGSDQNFLRQLLDNGADVTYRSASSPFACPDVVVAAAAVGNTVVLTHLIGTTAAVGVEPLLRDLTRLTIRDNAAPADRWCLRNMIGRSVECIVQFGAANRALSAVVRDVDRRLSVTVHPTNISGDPIWENIHARLDSVDRLKHLCRLLIRRRIAENALSTIQTQSTPSTSSTVTRSAHLTARNVLVADVPTTSRNKNSAGPTATKSTHFTGPTAMKNTPSTGPAAMKSTPSAGPPATKSTHSAGPTATKSTYSVARNVLAATDVPTTSRSTHSADGPTTTRKAHSAAGRSHFAAKIRQLPIPSALKAYLLFESNEIGGGDDVQPIFPPAANNDADDEISGVDSDDYHAVNINGCEDLWIT